MKYNTDFPKLLRKTSSIDMYIWHRVIFFIITICDIIFKAKALIYRHRCKNLSTKKNKVSLTEGHNTYKSPNINLLFHIFIPNIVAIDYIKKWKIFFNRMQLAIHNRTRAVF